MAVHSSYLGSVKISGDEAAAFTRKVMHSRGTKAALESAQSGKRLTDAFAKNGVVKIKLQQHGRSQAK